MSRRVRRLCPAICVALFLVLLARAGVSAAGPRPPARVDRFGDPLPAGAVARLGTVRFRQGFFIYAAAFSPDGKAVAAAGPQHGVCLWDRATGKLRHQFLPGMHVYSVALSPDGKLLAAWGGRVGRDGIRLWDTATGKEVHRLATNANAAATMALAFSPDSKTLASGGHDNLVTLWDVATGLELRQLQGHQSSVLSVAFSPDGKTVASASLDQTARLWEVATGKVRAVLDGHGKQVLRVAFGRGGKVVATAGEDPAVRLWDAGTGKEIRALPAKDGAVQAVAFAPDGKTVASGHAEGIIHLWDAATGKERRAWRAHPSRITTVAFSPDGNDLLSTAYWDSAPRFWDPATGRERHPSDGHRGPVDLLAYAADGRVLFSGGRDGKVLRWNLARGTDRVLFPRPSYRLAKIEPRALSPDGKRLAAAPYPDYEIRLWDDPGAKAPRRLGKPGAQVQALAFSPDGKLLASAGLDRVIRLWDVGTGRELRQFKGHEDPVCTLAFSPDGKLLASGAETRFGGGNPVGRTVRLWDVATGKAVRAFDCRDDVFQVAFSPDGKRLACAGGYRGRSRLWDVATGKEVCLLAVPQSGYAVALSPDGRLLAWAGSELDCTVRVLEAATGQEVRHFPVPENTALAVAFAPDGRTLACGGCDSTILVWDVTGRLQNGRLRKWSPGPGDLEARWRELADAGAGKAFDALWALVAAPRQSVPFLEKHLHPLKAADPRRVAGLIAGLDSPRFAARRQAMRELEKLGDVAEPALRQALRAGPALEVRQRIGRLLARLDWSASAEGLRTLRALAALEQIGTAEARRLLQALAGGEPHARLTWEAKATLERLTRRPAARP